MTITKRSVKGSALTYEEMDENIRDLVEGSSLSDGRGVSRFGDRNLIINGDMRFWERQITTTTNLPDTGSGMFIPVTYISADRWGWSWNNTSTDTLDAGDLTTERSTDVPEGQGFKYSILLTKNGTGESGTGAFADPLNPSDSAITSNHLMQHIEGQMVQHLMWGTDNARPITLSFWVKASQAKKLAVGFLLDDTRKGYFTTTQINATDTWEKKVITIQGSTDYTINDDNGKGLSVVFSIMSGAEGNVTPDTWVNTDVFGGVLHPNVPDSYFFEGVAGNIRFTGVQLEVGESASGFEFENYSSALIKCQRYFYMMGGEAVYERFGTGMVRNNSTQAFISLICPTRMRGIPVASMNNAGNFAIEERGRKAVSSFIMDLPSSYNPHLIVYSSGLGAGLGAQFMADNTTAARLSVQSEIT